MRVEVQAGTTPSHAALHNHNKYVDRDQPRNASSRTAPADADAAEDGDANYVGDSGTGKRSGHQQKWQYWEVLMRYADGLDMALMGLGSLAALVDGLTLPAMLLIQSRLIHNLETLHDTPAHLVSAVSQNCLLFVYVALVSWIASCLEVSCWMQVGERQTTRIRAKYLQAVLRQDVVFFECEISTAEVINSISLDVALLQDSISEKVGFFVKNVAHFAGGYMVAFFQIWRIALLMIPFTPFFLLPGILYSKTISGSALEIRTSNEKSNTIAEQALSSIRTIYAFVAEEETIKSYTESLKKLVELGRKQGSIKGLAVGSNGLIFAVWAFLGWYGTALIVSGEANGGQLLTTGFAAVTGGLALGNALCYVKVFSDGCTAAQRIFQIIDRVPSIDINSTDGKILEVVEGKVEFRNVSFVYPSRVAVPVLQKLSLEFCPGKIAAIVGNTGSGKSTIISLIQRFYDPLSGAVFLDGFNIKELHLKWLRQIMGLVSQEPALFATSILNNLLHGKEDASMDEIVAAATLSGAHNFIVKLPNGYDTQVKALLAERISLLVQTAFTVLVSAIIALSTSWRLALVMIAMQPLVIYAYFYRNRSLAEFAKQEAHARQEAGQLAGEAVSMQKTVTSFCMQKQILSSFESKLEKTKKKMSKRSYQAGMGIGIAQFMLFASWALDFWYGGQLVKSHKSTAGDVFKTFYVLVSTGRMLAEAGMLTPDVGKASAALDFIFKIFNRATQIDSENQMGEKVEVINGEIEFKNVSFCYPSRPRMMIFRNFNLKVIAGTSLALVGQSGSGKSTIVGLIERFYDPLQGQVMIDGLDIRSMNLRMLRQHIGLVSQEPSLFATTIRENILLGKPESSEDEIIKAACAANAHSFISALPEGYSSSVGRLGLQLSGGQKQRIAIARAILKNPRILLLDEATSALDCDTEKQVQNALNAIMVGRTSVVIAHRLSTIREAHCIAVLHNGSIMEQGTHSQLLAKGQAGAYFSLVHSQIAAPLSENSTPFHI